MINTLVSKVGPGFISDLLWTVIISWKMLSCDFCPCCIWLWLAYNPTNVSLAFRIDRNVFACISSCWTISMCLYLRWMAFSYQCTVFRLIGLNFCEICALITFLNFVLIFHCKFCFHCIFTHCFPVLHNIICKTISFPQIFYLCFLCQQQYEQLPCKQVSIKISSCTKSYMKKSTVNDLLPSTGQTNVTQRSASHTSSELFHTIC